LPLPTVRLCRGDAAHGGTRRPGVRVPGSPAHAPAGGAGMKVFRPLALVLAAIVALVPLVWMVETSLKSNREITQDGTLYPHTPTLENYRSLFSGRDFGSYLTNSIGITGLSVLISLVVGSL